MMRELTYYVAVSLDGYIAGPGGEFDAFLATGDHMEPIWSRYRGTAPTELAEAAGLSVDDGPFDTVLMGRNTYAVGLPHLTNPYRHLRQIVFTSAPSQRPEGSDDVEFTAEDPTAVVRELKQEDGRGIWLCGGGTLAASLIEDIDRLALKINPVVLGEGIPVFGSAAYSPRAWRRTRTQSFESGVIFAEYARA